MMRIFAMVAYLLDMMLQVFLYCYQGNELLDEVQTILFPKFLQQTFMPY